jgi:hypothetical protein
VTTHSTVRNGRVFNVKLSDIRKSYPTVETWNSCGWCTIQRHFARRANLPWAQSRTSLRPLTVADENKTTGEFVVLGKDYMAAYN